MREGFAKLGYREVGDDDGEHEPIELILVNTCTVTAESEAKSRKIIRRLAKKHPAAEIIVLGCYAARAAEEAAKLPGVTEVIPDKRDLPELLKRRGLSEIPRRHLELRRPASGLGESARRLPAALQLLHRPAGAAASFQPAGRGSARRNRPLTRRGADCQSAKCRTGFQPVIRERQVGNLSYEAGFAEIVLTGIHLGHYGLEQPEPRTDLAGLGRKDRRPARRVSPAVFEHRSGRGHARVAAS